MIPLKHDANKSMQRMASILHQDEVDRIIDINCQSNGYSVTLFISHNCLHLRTSLFILNIARLQFALCTKQACSFSSMSLSELLKDLHVAVQTAINLENKLKDEKFINDLKEVVKMAKKGFTDTTGDALHRLHKTQPSIETVTELIEGIPDALSFKNVDDELPVQSALSYTAVKYIPILVKEGIKHNVGAKEMRGGLLLGSFGNNTLQWLVGLDNTANPIPCDTDCLEVIKELRKENILLKEDIKELDLLYWSCRQNSKMRFQYFAEWDPDSLVTCTYKDLPYSHAINENWRNDITRFALYFQTSLKHHPQHLGILFQKDKSGKVVYERAIEKHGKDKVFNVIKQSIPTDTHLPILHRVAKHAPKHMNDFTSRYTSALYLRDEDGRTLTQAAIACGAKTFKNDSVFIGKMTDDEIAELDPVTKQYPFLTSAACESGDLSTIYALLSRNPLLLEKYIQQSTDQFTEEAITQIKRRDNYDEEVVDEECVSILQIQSPSKEMFFVEIQSYTSFTQ